MRQALLLTTLLLAGCSSSSSNGHAGQSKKKETPREAAAQLNLPGGSARQPASGGTGGGSSATGPAATTGPSNTTTAVQTGANPHASRETGIRPGLSRFPGYQASLGVVDTVQNGGDSLARGYQLYQSNCAVCHGSNLKGPENTTTMPTRDLTQFTRYKYGSSDQALYRTLLYGIPRTAMGNFQDSFKAEQIWDLIHFMKSKRLD